MTVLPTTSPTRDEPAQSELPLAWAGTSFPTVQVPIYAEPTVGADERIWATGLLQAILEVLAGDRSPTQLTRWLTPGLRIEVTTRAALGRRSLPRIRSVHVVQPSARALELTAVLDYDVRHRAATLRLERRRGGWICTRLAIL